MRRAAVEDLRDSVASSLKEFEEGMRTLDSEVTEAVMAALWIVMENGPVRDSIRRLRL